MPSSARRIELKHSGFLVLSFQEEPCLPAGAAAHQPDVSAAPRFREQAAARGPCSTRRPLIDHRDLLATSGRPSPGRGYQQRRLPLSGAEVVSSGPTWAATATSQAEWLGLASADHQEGGLQGPGQRAIGSAWRMPPLIHWG